MENERLGELQAFAEKSRAQYVEVDVSSATDTITLIGAIRGILPFPSWCGSGWDSIDDAFNELRSTWPFPIFLVLRGYSELLASNQQLALEAMLRLCQLEGSFSKAEAQLIVAFAGDSWR